MGLYEALIKESPIPMDDRATLPDNIKGIYIKTRTEDVILLNRNIQTTAEKTCILAEELGHYHTSTGDITDQTKINNRKQERRAREWAHRRLIPLRRIVDAHKAHVTGRHELAEYLGVTEHFLQEAIDRYRNKYGPYVKVDDRYTIMFEPLSVIELFPE